MWINFSFGLGHQKLETSRTWQPPVSMHLSRLVPLYPAPRPLVPLYPTAFLLAPTPPCAPFFLRPFLLAPLGDR